MLSNGGLFLDRGEDDEGADGDDIGRETEEEDKRGILSPKVLPTAVSSSLSSSCLYSAIGDRTGRATGSIAMYIIYTYMLCNICYNYCILCIPRVSSLLFRSEYTWKLIFLSFIPCILLILFAIVLVLSILLAPMIRLEFISTSSPSSLLAIATDVDLFGAPYVRYTTMPT